MKSYGQHCALAKALDVIGDRWTLLIIRELMIRVSARYTDIRNGLPGIPTNLLVERLRDLEAAAIISRRSAPPPVATNLFALTERGLALEPILLQLGNWGAPFLADATEDEPMLGQWLIPPLKAHLRDASPQEPPVTIELMADGTSITVKLGEGRVDVALGSAPTADASVSGPPRQILKLLTGGMPFDQAGEAGLSLSGDVQILQRLHPRGVSPPPHSG